MKNHFLPLAKELIKIPYVAGSGEMDKAIKLIQLVKEQLPEFFFTPFASNGIPSILFTNKETEPKNFKIILNGHLDVVTGKKEQYIPIEKNGRLYGRGAYDMKTVAAVMIFLFKEIGPRLSYPLGLQLSLCEEVGGDDGTGYQINQGVRGDFVISGESGSNLRIVNEAKRRLILKLIANGKASHSAYPWKGDNAIWKLQQVVHAILQHYPLPKEESPSTTVNITTINTQNNIHNKTPSHCEAILDIRHTHDEQNFIEKIKSFLVDGVTIEMVDYWPIHRTDPNSKYIKLLHKTAQKVLNKNLPLARSHATSDMPFYSAVSCDSIEFGPIGHGQHEEDEWVDIKSVEDYYQLLKTFLLDL